MKKQSDNHKDESDLNDNDEITVKKVLPLDDDEAMQNEEIPDEALDYKLMYQNALDELKAAKDENLLRLAETENFKKRLTKEKEDFVKFANNSLLQELLPCLDNLDMTLTHATPEQIAKDPVISGVNLVLKQFLQTLQKQGLEEVPGLNQPFDPHMHEAIATQPQDGVAAGVILQVHRKGYKLAGKLIRPALVTVSA